jgi:hypothetical protein
VLVVFGALRRCRRPHVVADAAALGKSEKARSVIRSSYFSSFWARWRSRWLDG